VENTQFIQNDVSDDSENIEVSEVSSEVVIDENSKNKQWIIVVCILVASCVMAGIYYLYNNKNETYKFAQVQASNTEERIRSVVLVEVAKNREVLSRGSGLFISKEGHILTNAHVVINPKTEEIWSDITIYRTNDSTETAQCYAVAKVLSLDKKNDLALLQLSDLPDPTCKTSIGVSKGFWFVDPRKQTIVPSIGDEISVIGYPIYGDVNDRSVTVTRGYVSGFPERSRFIKTDAKTDKGSSGSAVFDKSGAFVGIVSGRLSESLDSLAAVIQVDVINQWFELLQNQGVLKGSQG